MTGERTLYRKVQVVLDYAKEGKHRDRATLIEYIVSRQPTNFVFYWRHRASDEVRHGYSEASIRRAIQACLDLHLLHGTELALTKRGLSATDPRRFTTIIGSSVSQFLESAGIPVTSIVVAISKILRSSKPRPPTAREIWDQLGAPEEAIDPDEFLQMITLLGQSQVLLMTQKRIYLPWSG